MKAKYKKMLKKYPIIGFSILLVLAGINYFNDSNNIDEDIVLAKCVDGDTARFIIDGKEEKVRFLAIDTPETVKPNTVIEPFGKEASLYACEALKNAKEIKLEYEDNKLDKYDRLLAWVWVDDHLLQEELVLKGLAKVEYLYDDYKYTNVLLDAEMIAKDSGIGIWSLEE